MSGADRGADAERDPASMERSSNSVRSPATSHLPNRSPRKGKHQRIDDVRIAIALGASNSDIMQWAHITYQGLRRIKETIERESA